MAGKINLFSAMEIKSLLAKYDAKPVKFMGQHFLIDRRVLAKITDAAQLTGKETVVEIGPGIGTLTQELAKNAGRVIAIEKDKKMLAVLKETLKEHANVEVIEGNALNFNPINYKLQSINYKLIANIPYYITAPIIRKFLELSNPPSEMVLMVQKEVAQRICAKPPSMSLLSVSVQFYAKAKIISYVSKNCFWPAPKVDSAIIKITPVKKARRSPTPASFFKIVKAGFSQPRKQLANNLAKSLKKSKEEAVRWLEENGIKPEQRAETLSIADWEKLTDSFSI